MTGWISQGKTTGGSRVSDQHAGQVPGAQTWLPQVRARRPGPLWAPSGSLPPLSRCPPPAPRALRTHHGRETRGPARQRRQQAPRRPPHPQGRRHASLRGLPGALPARRPQVRPLVCGQLPAAGQAAPHSRAPPRRPRRGPAPKGPGSFTADSAGSGRTRRARPRRPPQARPLSEPTLRPDRVCPARGPGFTPLWGRWAADATLGLGLTCGSALR